VAQQKVKRPFKERGTRKPLDESEWRAYSDLETNSGAGRAVRVPRFFLERLQQLAPGDGPEIDRPEWAAEILHKGGGPDDLIEALERRVVRSPRGENLRDALAVFNELCRDPEVGPRAHKRVTQELVDRLIEAGRK
jgi:hypothetical protein